MGYRDSVDPAKMEMEGSSSFMPIASLKADSTPQIISSGAKEREESAARSENEERPSTSTGEKV